MEEGNIFVLFVPDFVGPKSPKKFLRERPAPCAATPRASTWNN